MINSSYYFFTLFLKVNRGIKKLIPTLNRNQLIYICYEIYDEWIY